MDNQQPSLMPTTFNYICEDCNIPVEYTRQVGIRKDGLTRKYCEACARSRQTQCALKWYHSKSKEIRASNKQFHMGRRLAVIQRLGGKCECCGESNTMFLEVDHSNSDGKEQRIAHPGQFTIYAWLVKHNFPPGFRLLCSNCNRGRWRNGGTCPHEDGSQARAKARSSKRSEVPEALTKGHDMVVSSVKAGAIQFQDTSGRIYWPLRLN